MALPIYTDMNVMLNTKETLNDIFTCSSTLGFERLVVNNVAATLKTGKGKKQEQKSAVTPASDILLNDPSIDAIKVKYPRFQQLSRFTAILDDAANTHRLTSPEVQAYDIIAVQPTNEKTFQIACSTLEVDIISLNISESLGFSPKRPLIKLAIRRGIHFELTYSPALKDSSTKRNIISNAMSFISVARGRGVIISSGAQHVMDVRSPFDVMNLGKLFGLTPSQAKDAVCKNCRAVLKHAEARKTCKSVISVSLISNLKPNENWVLEGSRTEALAQSNDDMNEDDFSSAENEDESESDDGESGASDSSETVSSPSKSKKRKLDASLT